MKLVLLCVLILAVIGQELHTFRYKDGQIGKGSKTINVAGSFFHVNSDKEIFFEIFAMQLSTMTPVLILGQLSSTETSADGIDYKYKCMMARWDMDSPVALTGDMKLTGSWEEGTAEVNCIDSISKERWFFKAKGIKSNKPFYECKEAGLRSRTLIGQSSAKFMTHEVISYAIIDYPYTNIDCSMVYLQFPVMKEAKPGYLLVGKDKKHCAILDHEGDKFIHTNTKAVIETPLAMANQFFPNGFEFRGYPDLLTEGSLLYNLA